MEKRFFYDELKAEKYKGEFFSENYKCLRFMFPLRNRRKRFGEK